MIRKIRKTGELIDVISWTGNITRDEAIDTVSYIDSKGVEHPREEMNFYWDLTQDTPDKSQKQYDFDWDKYRYEIIKSIYPACIEKYGFNAFDYVAIYADDLIKKLKSEKDGGVQGV